MPALVAGIHVFRAAPKGVDGRDKPGHDASRDSQACDGLVVVMPPAHIHNALVEWLALRPGFPGANYGAANERTSR